MKLSDNFSLNEFVRSATAERLKIDNSPTPEHIDNLKVLCIQLEKIREQFGPVRITSGYRSAKLNAAVGGSRTSQHNKGQAADIVIDGQDLIDVAYWIKENCEFDQLIAEDFSKDKIVWIHVSAVIDGNRKQCLTMVRKNGKPLYQTGLPKRE